MSGHATHNPHGSGIRGLAVSDSKRIPEVVEHIDNHQGQFGRLFSPANAPPATFDLDALEKLAVCLGSHDGPKDGADDEESHIPAAYTYFGQFIDHDLTFDPSTFAQQKSDPTAISDFRTPKFDLDNVYGRGPSDQPFLFDGVRMLEGEAFFPVTRNPMARDLPRANNTIGGRRAIIGDPRNDENAIVSQFQGMMFRFHNRVAKDQFQNKVDSFNDVSTVVRRHYQWLVVHDFLTRIVRSDILDAVSTAIRNPTISFEAAPPVFKLFTGKDAFMPVEFSVAAYRLGHSMVRPGYRLSDTIAPLPIFNAANPSGGLNAFGAFPNSWTIDWQRFIDLGLGPKEETKEDRVQMAYKIDTSLVEPLGNLPDSVAGDEAKANIRLRSLAYRNMLRGQLLKLPSGQTIAKLIGAKVLDDEHIIIGAATNREKPMAGNAKTILQVDSSFKGNCPLWVYVLAEAKANFHAHGEARLGDVGGRIVAETFAKLLVLDPSSILHHHEWKPSIGNGSSFTLSDLLIYALG